MKKIILMIVALVVVAAGVGGSIWYLKRDKPASVIDEVGFKKLAEQTLCAERGIKLHVINEEMVFYTRKGGCPDNYYAYRLYGTSPEQELCSQSDSIEGPHTECEDESKHALFETMVEHQDQPNLGLSSNYHVRPLQ